MKGYKRIPLVWVKYYLIDYLPFVIIFGFLVLHLHMVNIGIIIFIYGFKAIRCKS